MEVIQSRDRRGLRRQSSLLRSVASPEPDQQRQAHGRSRPIGASRRGDQGRRAGQHRPGRRVARAKSLASKEQPGIAGPARQGLRPRLQVRRCVTRSREPGEAGSLRWSAGSPGRPRRRRSPDRAACPEACAGPHTTAPSGAPVDRCGRPPPLRPAPRCRQQPLLPLVPPCAFPRHPESSAGAERADALRGHVRAWHNSTLLRDRLV